MVWNRQLRRKWIQEGARPFLSPPWGTEFPLPEQEVHYMKRRILSIITALALCLSLCPTWAFAVEGEPDTGLCDHHPEHIGCGYTAPTEGHDCGHEHTEDCYTTDEAGGEVLDCHHSHDSECGYIAPTDGAPCGYECRICPIEDLIAALPEQVTEDNAADVRGQLDHISP